MISRGDPITNLARPATCRAVISSTLAERIWRVEQLQPLATVALMLTLSVTGVYAQDERPVKMTFSGTNVATTINLRPGTYRRTPVSRAWFTRSFHLFGSCTLIRAGLRRLLRAPVLIFWLSLERAYFASKTEVF